MSEDALAARWGHVRAGGRAALIPYVTAGYPSREISLAALHMLAESGADFVEVGIPFSDPLADGPVIQRSSHIALEQGMTVEGALDLVRSAALDIPVIAFGYLNPILAYGLSRFLDDAHACGVAGVLITDLPVGEDRAIEEAVRESPLALIRLVAPTTSPERMGLVVREAEGFVYLIARLGVTGSETTIGKALEAAVHSVRAATTLPVAVGFGIASGDQAARVAALADGVVVGSALVRRLGDGLEAARDLMMELSGALRGSVDLADTTR